MIIIIFFLLIFINNFEHFLRLHLVFIVKFLAEKLHEISYEGLNEALFSKKHFIVHPVELNDGFAKYIVFPLKDRSKEKPNDKYEHCRNYRRFNNGSVGSKGRDWSVVNCQINRNASDETVAEFELENNKFLNKIEVFYVIVMSEYQEIALFRRNTIGITPYNHLDNRVLRNVSEKILIN